MDDLQLQTQVHESCGLQPTEQLENFLLLTKMNRELDHFTCIEHGCKVFSFLFALCSQKTNNAFLLIVGHVYTRTCTSSNYQSSELKSIQISLPDKQHHQCSKLPVAYSPLATNFSRWRPPTCDLVAKKKKNEKKKMKNRAVANLSQRRRADRERAFFLPFFRFRGFGLIENETRIAKLPRVTRRPTRGATEQ